MTGECERPAIEHLDRLERPVADERMVAFVASGLEPSQQRLDETEQIEVHPTPVDEALQMIKRGEIEDAKSIATLLYWRFL